MKIRRVDVPEALDVIRADADGDDVGEVFIGPVSVVASAELDALVAVAEAARALVSMVTTCGPECDSEPCRLGNTIRVALAQLDAVTDAGTKEDDNG